MDTFQPCLCFVLISIARTFKADMTQPAVLMAFNENCSDWLYPLNVAELAAGDPEEECRFFLGVECVDGAFSDFPETFAFVLAHLNASSSTPAYPEYPPNTDSA